MVVGLVSPAPVGPDGQGDDHGGSRFRHWRPTPVCSPGRIDSGVAPLIAGRGTASLLLGIADATARDEIRVEVVAAPLRPATRELLNHQKKPADSERFRSPARRSEGRTEIKPTREGMTIARAGETEEATFEDRELLYGLLPEGRARRVGESLIALSGLPVGTLNGVWSMSPEQDSNILASLLDEISATKLPHCFQFGSPSRSARDLASRAGLVRIDDVPLMRLDGIPVAGNPAGFCVEQLEIDNAGAHAEVAAAGFDAPLEVFQAIVSPKVTSHPGISFYLGRVRGRPVATGASVTIGEHTGVLNVTTLPQYRRRGYGAALTADIVRYGYAAGARWAWLQSSAEGLPVYKRIGFETIATWECWTTGD